ncbi:unnamed protein product [Rotaria socialis]|uniref:Uncharacterized protein n=1 Tax=Rotaria socialis TaxID=392032 RepID=A0A818LJP8_9BILA|nr:unnamed protein product [Rotaria socialis]CAF3573242.1 unnamed protein product [Rotaria socialis]CAF3608120.1 unnamed protein product [Rotaria socialis]CAF4226851.1 unnamed protein product [Rotaria socialis]CAF4456627.1 unnamed protein product [Rotaria socialis]
MYLSKNDVKETTDVDNNIQMRQANTSPITSDPPQSLSPPCPTLLVIDDNSNSEDSTVINTDDIPNKPMLSTNAQIAHIKISTALSPSTVDIAHGTAEQQRRRNSSIAKLLGGQPLNNQQYEEINQQILDAQSAHNVSNSADHGVDSGIQRTRSSITRTLLMNTEKTNVTTETPTKTQVAPTTSSFPKDFEYLIRREPDKFDTEHAPFSLQRNNSMPKSSQNLNSSSKKNVHLAAQSKLKRMRSISKSSSITPNKSTINAPPFSLHDPFELQSPATNAVPSIHHPQNEFLCFNTSKRPRHSNLQQHGLPIDSSTKNQFSYPSDKMDKNSSVYDQFSIYQDRIPSNNSSPYSHTTALTLSSPVAALSSSTTERYNNNNTNNNNATVKSMRKAKSIFAQSNVFDFPKQRPYCDRSDQSDSLLAASSEPNVPLKKRLLHAYNNEQRPT